MFKPVTDFSQYDQETVNLYSKRPNDPRLTYILSACPRKGRHNFPVLNAEESNPYLEKLQRDRDNFKYKFFFGFAVFAFACHRFSKAYYPYGIIVRRAVPTTQLQQASYYGPMLGVFAYVWWMLKEHPRSQRIDLSDPSEK